MYPREIKNYTSERKKKMEEKNYARLQIVVFAEVGHGETLEEVEARVLKSLPEGVDVTSCKSDMWVSE